MTGSREPDDRWRMRRARKTMKKRWNKIRVLRGAVYIHLAACTVALVGICTTLHDTGSSGVPGLGPIDTIIIWTLDHPCPFYWGLLSFDFVALYVLHGATGRAKRIALGCYVVAVPIIALLHISVVTVASFRGTIYSPTATYVIEGFGVLRAVAIGDILLALPLALTILGERLRSTDRTLVCRACGYDLTGLASDRCPECGDLVLKAQGARE